ncbi:hypothetical protein MAR_011322 [Mya arenaria]|uniref:Uncharacterized protein n=1 Tax=Mya arenaria TaxID=6604 RepID=A0ABY7FTT1_MYAAR|nr:hypothetical protein MAR_011322 [Mya arenaria]
MWFGRITEENKDLTISITVNRLKEIELLFKCWIEKDYASRREVQALLGNLNFIGACCRSRLNECDSVNLHSVYPAFQCYDLQYDKTMQ